MATIKLGVLNDLRVVDMTGAFGAYASRLLADLGACVVRVQPNTGDIADTIGPFHETNGRSYFATFVNANKRSVTASPAALVRPEFLSSLFGWADLVIEELPTLLDCSDTLVAAAHEAAADTVIVSIRPFAEGSASAKFKINDLAAQAVGGLMSLTGTPQREPLSLYGGQSHYIVGVHAASAAMIGLNDQTGRGTKKRYTVTIHEAIVNTLETAVQYYTTEGVIRARKGAVQQAGDGSYQTKDGPVVLGAMTDLDWSRLISWMGKLGMPGIADLANWTVEQRRDPKNISAFARVFEDFAKNHLRQTLTAAGQAERVLICPSYSLTQILTDGQLTYDQFFREVQDSAGESWIFPGAPYRISSGTASVREAARKFGQDNDWFMAEIRKPARTKA